MEQHSQEVMGIDLVGRVKKIQLAERNMLLPLFEAIVNSIHAIEDAKIPNGEISVTIHRELPFDESEENGFGIPDITQFDIEDNGIGFNAANYTSFKKADSTLKASRGAKGVGRFIWLKTFTDVHIESVFYENKKPLQRKFNFNIRVDSGINNSSLNGLTGTPKRGTKVELVGYKDPYKSKCPKRTSTIANRIIEHCLIYFKAPNCPIISIIDGSTSINLNNKFKELTFGNSYTGNFEIREYKFKVTLYKWFEHDELTHHKMSLCANNREVEDFDISKVFQDIQGKILDDESNKYYLITGYIESDYLDVNVNDERTKIKFASGGMFDDNLISRSELYESISPIIKEHFEQVVVEFHKKKIETLHAFINESAPQYKILLSKEGILDNVTITENNTEQDIDLKLYKIYQEIDYESRKNVAQIIQEIGNGDVEDNNLGDKYRKILHEISEVNKSKLAQYIVHRKYILELFDKSLGLNDDGSNENLAIKQPQEERRSLNANSFKNGRFAEFC